jgi:hypothetical protein
MLRLYYLLHEKYKVYKQVSKLGDVFVYRYRRRPLLLVQVQIENKDILCIYTSNHGQ